MSAIPDGAMEEPPLKKTKGSSKPRQIVPKRLPDLSELVPLSGRPHVPFCEHFCMKTERVAPQRKLVDDDQWVAPHNLDVAMYSPSPVDVLPFDSHKGRAARMLRVRWLTACHE